MKGFSAIHVLFAVFTLIVGLVVGGLGPRNELHRVRGKLEDLEAKPCRNNTGADIDRTLSISVGTATATALLRVADKTSSLTVIGLLADVGGFVVLSGNFGVQKTAGATAAEDELLIVSDKAAASLTAGSAVRVGVKDAAVAVLIRGDQKMALQASGAVDLALGGG